jgi:uncharacterized repeat protein (TIGR03803 family)
MPSGRIGVIALLVSLTVAPASSELTQPGATATLPWKFTALHHFDNVPLTLNPLLRAADGNFYGTSRLGGPGDTGTVLKITPAGALTVLHWFTGGEDGAGPVGSLIQATDGNFYGTTSAGGTAHAGVIFKVTPAGVITTLHSFSQFTTGLSPAAGVIQASDGHFYGTTDSGGASSFGTIYRMTSDGTVTVLHSFGGAAAGRSPRVALVEGPDQNFYGISRGGTAERGTVFRITPGGAFTVLHLFAGGSDGEFPSAPLITATDGNLYGTTSSGGSFDRGTIFKMTTAGVVTVVNAFANADDGWFPEGPLLHASDGNFYGTTSFGGPSFTGSVFKMTAAGAVSLVYGFPADAPQGSPAHTLVQSGQDLYGTTQQSSNLGGGAVFKVTMAGAYSLVRAFPGRTAGSTPRAPLIQASNGLLYGTTFYGGAANIGTIFSITLAGVLAPLLNFDFSVFESGMHPETGLLQAADGNLYATTQQFHRVCLGGCSPSGTISRITTAGAQTYLHRFDGTEGTSPAGPLVQGTDGNFYGATAFSGAHGGGAAFRMAADGTATVLHAFNQDDQFGATPRGGLTRGSDGNLYGTTSTRGLIGGFAVGSGTVFRMTPSGTLTVLHTFDGDNGSAPYGELVQATDGAFYGTTLGGGANLEGVAYKITAGGAFTLLHHFGAGADGANPNGALVQAADGTFYGTTRAGGASNLGTIFSMTGAGVVTVLHSFAGADGSRPRAGLIQAADGRFYGTTAEGGATASGVVFRLHLTAPFTDEPLSSNVSVIRAVHITELRTRINAVRAARGLAGYEFQDPTLVSGMTMIRAQHIQDLRAALHQAYVAAGVTPPTYSDPSLTTGTVAMAVHIAELRSAVTTLE